MDSWNGILAGYVLSYRNHEFDRTLKRTIDDPKMEVCLSVFLLINSSSNFSNCT